MFLTEKEGSRGSGRTDTVGELRVDAAAATATASPLTKANCPTICKPGFFHCTSGDFSSSTPTTPVLSYSRAVIYPPTPTRSFTMETPAETPPEPAQVPSHGKPAKVTIPTIYWSETATLQLIHEMKKEANRKVLFGKRTGEVSPLFICSRTNYKHYNRVLLVQTRSRYTRVSPPSSFPRYIK